MKLPKSLTTVTTFSKIIAVLVFFILVFGSFKAGMNYQRSLNVLEQKSTSTITVPSSSPKQNTHGIQISMQDNGKIKQVKVEDRVVVQLSDGLTWNVQLSNNNILQPSPDGVFYIHATQGRYKAVAPGTVDITGEGRPQCKPGEMCAQYIVGFKTTVNVTK